MEVLRIEHYLLVENLEFLVYLLTLIVGIVFLYGFYRHFRIWFNGYNFWEIFKQRPLSERLASFVKYGLLQEKVVKSRSGIIVHLPIYIGIVILFIGTILRALEYDVAYKLFGLYFLKGWVYLIYKLTLNIGGILLIIGCLAAWIRRISGKDGLPTRIEDHVVLLSLFTIAVTGFLLDGISTLKYRMGWINGFDFIGYLIALTIRGSGMEGVAFSVYPYIWIFHMLLALLSIAAIPYSKFFHLLAGGVFNTLLTRSGPLSALKPIEDLDKKLESGAYLGAERVTDLSWKERLDYDSCVSCARCHNNCPANLTGKPLSPMNLILEMREVMLKEGLNGRVLTEKNTPKVFWSCVTCGACVEQCPLLIHHVETIIDVRRWMISTNQEVPDEILQLSYNVMRAMNPYGMDPYEKVDFAQKLSREYEIEIAEEGKEYDVLYWIGCNVALDLSLQPIAHAMVKLLKASGLKVALIPEEGCCGDPVRRTGDELLFREMVVQTGENLKRYNFKTLVVTCPHGYNTFKHEYPQFGYRFDVKHYTEFLKTLIDEGKLKVNPRTYGKLTYHDPCYLARWNNITEEPRILLRRAGVDIVEMGRNRENTFCCGGGGGGAFFDIKVGDRISKVRIGEARDKGIKTIVVACPFCNMMLKAEAPALDMEIKDLAIILAEALENFKNETQNS